MNIVNNNTPNSPAASDAALRAQAASAANSTPSGSFADLLRNFDSSHINVGKGSLDLGTAQPVRPAPESAPTPPDASNANANVARTPDGPSETQRQEARAAAAPATAPAPQAAQDTAEPTQTADAADANSQPAAAKAKATDEPNEGASAKAGAQSTEQSESIDPLDKPAAKKARNAKLLLGDAAAGADAKQTDAKAASTDASAQVQVSSMQPASHMRLLSADKGAADTTSNVTSDSGKSAVSTQGRANARQADQTMDLRADQAATRAGSIGEAIQTTQATAQNFATELRSVTAGMSAGARVSPDAQAVLGALGGASGSTATATGSTSSTAAAATLSLAQPLNDAGFGAELGARLTVLTQDGVQHAELHLNPADMGPVAVQISVDGQQAQISFHAAHAETRAVLEQSLPDLAAALSASGLTLAGGGVFQQSQGGQAGQSGKGSSGTGSSQRGADADDSGSAGIQQVAMPGKAARGVVDLYV